MEEMYEAFQAKGLDVPPGLIELIQSGKGRKYIFRRLWIAARFGASLGGHKKTFVFPIEVRRAIREQYPDEMCACYDEQYEGDHRIYKVSIEEMSMLTYPRMKRTN